MNKFILILFLISKTLISINCYPEIKKYFIVSNNVTCALMDISSEIKVKYLTNSGIFHYVKLNLSHSASNQFGLCDKQLKIKFSIFIEPTEILTFNFINSNETVLLESLQFSYTTPNIHFPGSKNKGMKNVSLLANMKLSKSDNYYQCNSKLKFILSDEIILNVYSFKVKVFNVVNNSFGGKVDKCTQKVDVLQNSLKISQSYNNRFDKEIISNNDKFYVIDKTNGIPCLIIQAKISLYISIASWTKEIETANFSQITNKSYIGYCFERKNIVIISWLSMINITMEFSNFDGCSNFDRIVFNLTTSPAYFPKITPGTEIYNSLVKKGQCDVSIGNTYSCKNKIFELLNAIIIFENFKYEAFRKSKEFEFVGTEEQCGTNKGRKPQILIIIIVVVVVLLIISIVSGVLIYIFKFKKRRNYQEL